MRFDLVGPGGDYRGFGESDVGEEALVSDAIEGFGETVGGHIGRSYVLYREFTKFDTLFGVVVGYIDVLSTLMMTVRLYQFECWLVIAVQQHGVGIVAGVAYLV